MMFSTIVAATTTAPTAYASTPTAARTTVPAAILVILIEIYRKLRQTWLRNPRR